MMALPTPVQYRVLWLSLIHISIEAGSLNPYLNMGLEEYLMYHTGREECIPVSYTHLGPLAQRILSRVSAE